MATQNILYSITDRVVVQQWAPQGVLFVAQTWLAGGGRREGEMN